MRLYRILALALIMLAPTTTYAQFELVNPFWEQPAPHRTIPAEKTPWSNITCRDSRGELPWATLRPGKMMVIFLCEQYFVAYQDHGIRMHGPVSTGMLGHETPPGLYNIIADGRKGAEYRSREYPKPNGGAPMPYAMFFTMDGQAIHGGDMYRPVRIRGKPYGMSHGCVRVETAQAHWLNMWSDPQFGKVEIIVVRDVAEFYELWDKPAGEYYRPWQK